MFWGVRIKHWYDTQEDMLSYLLRADLASCKGTARIQFCGLCEQEPRPGHTLSEKQEAVPETLTEGTIS